MSLTAAWCSLVACPHQQWSHMLRVEWYFACIDILAVSDVTHQTLQRCGMWLSSYSWNVSCRLMFKYGICCRHSVISHSSVLGMSWSLSTFKELGISGPILRFTRPMELATEMATLASAACRCSFTPTSAMLSASRLACPGLTCRLQRRSATRNCFRDKWVSEWGSSLWMLCVVFYLQNLKI